MNSGSARLVKAARVNTGAVNTGTAHSSDSAPALNCPRASTSATPAASVTTTAYRGASRRDTRYASSMSTTSGSAVCAAANACRPKRASTPASSADAMAMGMRFMTRSNQPVAPARVMSAPHTRNAPIASFMEKPPARPALASTAAPGVLQAIITGCFKSSDGMADVRPMPSPSAHIHEVICSGVAPNACAA